MPSHQNNDVGTIELKNLLLRYELDDIWRSRFPDTKRYTFQRGNSKSRIDFIFCSKSLNTNVVEYLALVYLISHLVITK